MQHNRVKAALAQGKAVTGPIISEMRSTGGVRLMANAGHDFMFFDMEHAMYDWDVVLQLVQMALACDICPLVRPTDNIYALVARALDAGGQGVIIPRIETAEQAQATVQYAKYPPQGRRGAGGDARNGYARKSALEAIESANRESLIVVQIESVEGVNSAEAIAAVEGIDVLLIGPQDLSISLGCHGDFGHATFLDAAQTVVAAGQRHGKAIGMVEREAADFRRWFEMGMRFLVCSTDSHMLYSSASRNVQELRALAG